MYPIQISCGIMYHVQNSEIFKYFKLNYCSQRWHKKSLSKCSYMETCLCHNVVFKRKPWTDVEREAVLRHLQLYVLRSVLPGISCMVGILFY